VNAVIVGVSPDPVNKQCKFKEKNELNFVLLADEDHAVAEAFGAWVEKSMYGRKYMGIERQTFVIDPEGKVAKTYHKVKAAGHAAEVLAAIRAM
jgi:thioredoxin-dependent peroxiredoxin